MQKKLGVIRVISLIQIFSCIFIYYTDQYFPQSVQVLPSEDYKLCVNAFMHILVKEWHMITLLTITEFS